LTFSESPKEKRGKRSFMRGKSKPSPGFKKYDLVTRSWGGENTFSAISREKKSTNPGSRERSTEQTKSAREGIGGGRIGSRKKRERGKQQGEDADVPLKFAESGEGHKEKENRTTTSLGRLNGKMFQFWSAWANHEVNFIF